MKDWNGEERRMNATDHDLLTRIDANLDNFLKEFNDLKDEFAKHKTEDVANFSLLNRFMWMVTGGFILVETFLHFLEKK